MPIRADADSRQTGFFLDSIYFRVFSVLLLALISLVIARNLAFILGFRAVIAAVSFVVLLFLYFRSGKMSAEAKALVFPAVFSAVSTCAFPLISSTGRRLEWLLLFLLCFLVMRHVCLTRTSTKILRSSFLVGLLFAVLFYFGSLLKEYDGLQMLYSQPLLDAAEHMLKNVLGLALLFSSILCAFFNYLMTHDFLETGEIAPRSPVKLACICGAFIVLSYLPYFISFYPGFLYFDSVQEIYSMLGKAPVTNHHPVFHQLVLLFFIKVGRVFDSLQLGLGLCSLFQIFAMAAAFALTIWYLRAKGTKKSVLIILTCIYAFSSTNIFLSMALWKDTLFGVFTLLLMVMLLMEAEGTLVVRHPAVTFICTVLAALLFCVSRNNGFPAFLISFPFFILFNRRSFKRLLLMLAIVVTVVLSYQFVLFYYIGIPKSTPGESLSIPLQQIARTEKLYGEEFTEDERAALDEVFHNSEELGERYQSYISDPVKNSDSFRDDAFVRDPSLLLRLWVHLGLKYPAVYIDAFLLQGYGYWYPDITYGGQYTMEHTLNGYIGIPVDTEANEAREWLKGIHAQLSKNGPTAILHSVGLVAWTLIVCAVLLCMKGYGRLASPLIILAAIWLTCCASPVFCEYRYIYGLAISTPLFLALSVALPAKHTSDLTAVV